MVLVSFNKYNKQCTGCELNFHRKMAASLDLEKLLELKEIINAKYERLKISQAKGQAAFKQLFGSYPPATKTWDVRQKNFFLA